MNILLMVKIFSLKNLEKKSKRIMNQCQNQKNTIDLQTIIDNYGADAPFYFV